MEFRTLSREEFVEFGEAIEDKKSKSFAISTCLGKWDWMQKWGKSLPTALVVDGEITSVIFYELQAKSNTFILQLILTPMKHRRKGYAEALTAHVWSKARLAGMDRVKITCEIPALPFYKRLNFQFWGVQKGTDFAINLPMMVDTLDEFVLLDPAAIRARAISELDPTSKLYQRIDKSLHRPHMESPSKKIQEALDYLGDTMMYNEFIHMTDLDGSLFSWDD